MNAALSIASVLSLYRADCDALSIPNASFVPCFLKLSKTESFFYVCNKKFIKRPHFPVAKKKNDLLLIV